MLSKTFLFLVGLVSSYLAWPWAETALAEDGLKTVDYQGATIEENSAAVGEGAGGGSADAASSMTPEQMAQMMKTLQEAKAKQLEAQEVLKEIEANE